MSDTPRTNECTFDVIVKRGDAHLGVEHYKDGSGDFVESDFCKKLERELNAANSIIRQQQLLDEENLRLRQRIKRLEEVGDEMKVWCNDKKSCEHWDKIKEDKYE